MQCNCSHTVAGGLAMICFGKALQNGLQNGLQMQIQQCEEDFLQYRYTFDAANT